MQLLKKCRIQIPTILSSSAVIYPSLSTSNFSKAVCDLCCHFSELCSSNWWTWSVAATNSEKSTSPSVLLSICSSKQTKRTHHFFNTSHGFWVSIKNVLEAISFTAWRISITRESFIFQGRSLARACNIQFIYKLEAAKYKNKWNKLIQQEAPRYQPVSFLQG